VITLNPLTHHAAALLSKLAEACVKDLELNASDLARAAEVDIASTRDILSTLMSAEIVIEGFDNDGYRLAREPAGLTMLDIAPLFDARLQNNLAGISRAMRPAVEDYLRNITFAACALGKCDTDADSSSEKNIDCVEAKLNADT